jgi:ribonuclease BN (tRNA processing enzyme)
VTHLHGDHTAGWPFLLLHQVFLHRRERPFEIHGPAGTRTVLEGLVGHSYGDLLERGRHEIVYREQPVAEGRDLEGGGSMRYDVLPMDHHETSIGFRFRWDGTTIAVSGDTRWSPELERLAAGADLLVLECTSVAPTDAAHVSLAELREGRSRLTAGRIALVHLDDTVAEALARDPLPEVTAAHDGMELQIGRS